MPKGVYDHWKFRGTNNYLWKGDSAGYFPIHSWLIRNFGKAKMCENKECSGIGKRFEWALIRGRQHSHNRDNYMQLCASCHRRYDYTEEQRKKVSKSLEGVTPGRRAEPVIQIDLAGNLIKQFPSALCASKELGINRTSIVSVIKGRYKTAGGFIWRKVLEV